MKTVIVILCLVLLVGCSSLRYHPEQKTLGQANIAMKNAQTLENEGQYTGSLNTYVEAYQKYSLIDRLDGKAQAMLALTREYYRLGDDVNFKLWRDSVSTLINLNLPKMKDQLNLLEIEISFRDQDYMKVLDQTASYQDKPMQTAIEFCSYRLISKAKIKYRFKTEKQFLQDNIEKLAKQYHKNKLEEPSILAFAYYSIGYVEITQNEYKNALDILTKAYLIDQSEERYSDIADDVYLIGTIHEKLQQNALAYDCYCRALKIGIQLNDTEMQNRIKQRMQKLIP